MSKLIKPQTLTNSAATEYLKFVINSNKYNYTTYGKVPLAVNIEGIHGIGKTSIVKQLAKELGAYLYMESLAQMTDPGELTGFPIAETSVNINGKNIWVPTNSLPSYLAQGATINSNVPHRTISAPPSKIKEMWEIRNEYEKKLDEYNADPKNHEQPVEPLFIYILDDSYRCNPLIMQSIMELLESQYCGTWKLPPNTHIIMTNNPDDGNYNVSNADGALLDRSITIKLKWSADDWAVQAEKLIDNRCINFVLMNKDSLITEPDETGVLPENYVSPRMMDKFFSLVGSMDDLTSPESLKMIRQCGAGTITPQLTADFISFITERGSALPSPKKILLEMKTEEVHELLKKEVGFINDPNSMKKATASVIITRLKNWLTVNHENLNKKDAEFIADRIEFIINKSQCCPTDLGTSLLLHVSKNCYNGGGRHLSRKLTSMPEISKMLMNSI